MTNDIVCGEMATCFINQSVFTALRGQRTAPRSVFKLIILSSLNVLY